jgi:hypothetical protein
VRFEADRVVFGRGPRAVAAYGVKFHFAALKVFFPQPTPAPQPVGIPGKRKRNVVGGRELIDAIEGYVKECGGPRKCSELHAAEALHLKLGRASATATIRALGEARDDVGAQKLRGRKPKDR